ncbi:PREDICTED: putative ER lumen protein-retaining receptor C28H8.4 [Tarenaya hassleriana]|uniref:putative ER lumen protein-retaining receptor C28H8.4 n=1 Tax=Tarenaya hassleriana TaxID=28532 RepID=UPI00053C3C20|nr:PREDICTED: putative ER lumen protein-retaining receptor C28H8.4 [Tarenaya hassleriana]
MGKRRGVSAVNVLFAWQKRLSKKVKTALGIILSLLLVVSLRFTVKNHNHFFVASESIHAAGIFVLIYKLTRQKTCSGLSLKSQEVTAIFLAVRLMCSLTMEGDIHTFLDFATFVSTLWVIYMIRYKLNSSYVKELDNFPIYYLVVPSAILAFLINPTAPYHYIVRVMWAFCVYSESVSVLPQLRLMQNAKMIEPFTAHYVFALGIARFLACAHWLIRVYETRGRYLWLIGAGYFWFPAALLSEVVQTFILADFCYYYVKSAMEGQLVLKMPV